MSSKMFNEVQQDIEQYKEIKEVLSKFQTGYRERNIEKVDAFFKELFIESHSTYVVGTGTNELFLGTDQVKELIKGDWESWGDMKIDCENAHTHIEGKVAWFAAAGSVKYIFEDSQEKYDRYLNFIKNKAEDTELTPKQKITFMNWALALAFHQRTEEKREYLWPMQLSGILLSDGGEWKISQLKFSMARANFPDERFENSKEHLESYNKLKSIANGYENDKINEQFKNLLKGLETEFFGQKDIPKELVNNYFGQDCKAYVIGMDNQIYNDVDQIRNFFKSNGDSKLSLDLDQAITSETDEVTWVTVTGILKQAITDDQLAESALVELANLFHGDLNSKEKLFAAHRKISYVLKECASGVNYTWPIRITAVISKGHVFQQIHFSFPFYWIIEGKLDSL